MCSPAGIASSRLRSPLSRGRAGDRAQALVELEEALHLTDRLVEQGRDVLGRRLAIQLLGEAAGRAQIMIDRLDDMHGETDRARMIHDRALYRLANPPGGIGRETEAALRIELSDRMNEAEIAFLDEVQQRQAAFEVLAGNPDDEAQVALDHALPRTAVAVAGPPAEHALLLGREQRRQADLAQIEPGRVRWLATAGAHEDPRRPPLFIFDRGVQRTGRWRSGSTGLPFNRISKCRTGFLFGPSPIPAMRWPC